MICKRFRENCQNTALKFTVNSLNQETIPIDQYFDQVFVNLDISFDIQNESVDRLLTVETSKEEKQECIPDLLDDKIDAENLIDVDLRKSSRKILKKSKLKDTKQTPTKSDDEIGNPERIKNICEICHKSFYKLEYYEAHLRWHDGDLKPYECAACKKRLKTEHCLRAHMLNHRRLIKAFKCPDCEGTYANSKLKQFQNMNLYLFQFFQTPYFKSIFLASTQQKQFPAINVRKCSQPTKL